MTIGPGTRALSNIPFYVSANNKRTAAMNRRRRFLRKTVYGLGQITPTALWIEFNTLHPNEKVSLQTVKNDLRFLKDSERPCLFCRQLRRHESMVGSESE